MQGRLTVIQVLLACFTLSSLSGLASLINSGRCLTWRHVIGAFTYSGLFGVIWALICYRWFGGDEHSIYFLIGSAGLVGLGGTSLLDFVVTVIAKGGVRVVIQPDDDNN